MSATVAVHTQAELDAALAAHGRDSEATIIIASTRGLWLTLAPQGEQYARVSVDNGGRVDRVVNGGWVGSVVNGGRVDRVDSGGRVDRVDSGGWVDRVVNGGRVDRVDSGGRVGSVDSGGWVGSVVNGGRVGSAAGSSVIRVGQGGEVRRAGSHVAVYVYHQQVTVNGGHVIDMTGLDLDDPHQWCAYNAVEISDGDAILFKAVDADLNAGHSYRLTNYAVGSTVTAPDWRDTAECGHGLHASPSPVQARGYYGGSGEPRFLACAVPVATLRPLDDKAKTPSLLVLREVDLHGEPLAVSP